MEYGPGDILGIALLFYAFGAKKVICVDRFPMLSFSSKNVSILQQIIDALEGERKERAESCFNVRGKPDTGFRDDLISYLISRDGFSGAKGEADIVVSRAVLKHVNNLRATFLDMRTALHPGGIGVHLVDLKSHGLHQSNGLDFLRWPGWLWSLMYSHKGVPNRHQIDTYRRILDTVGFKSVEITPTAFADLEVIRTARACLAPPYRELSDEELGCLGFWLRVTK